MTANHHENNGADRKRVEELAVLATARGLDQLTADEEATLASALTKPGNQELQGASEQASRMAAAMAAAITANELPAPSAELRVAIEAELDAALVSPSAISKGDVAMRTPRLIWYRFSAALLTIAGVFACLLIPALQMAREKASRQTAVNLPSEIEEDNAKNESFGERQYVTSDPSRTEPAHESARPNVVPPVSDRSLVSEGADGAVRFDEAKPAPVPPTTTRALARPGDERLESLHALEVESAPSASLVGGMSGKAPDISVRGRSVVRPIVDKPGNVPSQSTNLTSKATGVVTNPTSKYRDPGQAIPSPYYLFDNVQYFESPDPKSALVAEKKELGENLAQVDRMESRMSVVSGEAYAAIRENAFRMVRDEPLSTFSIDVDTASYANVRRFLTSGQLPPKDAVRIEELLNYFSYDYPQPQEKDPFSVNLEVTDCPWRPENRLLRVGLKGREVAKQQRAATNLVFLIDVSGSMEPANKLPLVKTALKLLVQELTENDRVSIVTYAGDAGLKLPSTNGTEQSRILNTIDSLSAGGSTHGSAGIALAYEQASGYFIQGGTNRVILLTDGDLNVGITDDDALVQLIQQKAKSGVFLTVLGVGDGNLKDSKMEKLADHGNGVYAYLDGVREARKVLVEQMSGSLVTIAKDVKLQIEFNPAQVQAYRLVGYENRVLANRDFHDDTKDAGEIGAGHTVTALYELVPTNAPVPVPGEPLKYQPPRVEETPATPVAQASRELLTLKLRFKHPEADRSELRDYPLADHGGKFGQASTDFRFASSVAMFGLVLRDSQYRGSATLAAVEEIATSSLGQDPRGYRSEFVDLVRKAEQLK